MGTETRGAFGGVPYPTWMVVAGLAIGLLVHRATPVFAPSLVLGVFLPPLLFAAAWEMDLRELRTRWLPVALLATIGVAAGMAAAYALLRYGAGFDATAALVFSALVAATDPVAVIATFRALRVERGLRTIVEGESIFNDGIAVVLFRAFAAGAVGAAGFDTAGVLRDVAWSTVGGAAIGAAAGAGAALALRAARAPFLDIAATAVTAYGADLLGEAAHASGIVAVIAAGLACSIIRNASGSTADAAEAVDRFWERAAFLANAVLFVLVGLAIDPRALVGAGAVVVWAIAAVVLGRVLMVYGLMALASLGGAAGPGRWRPAIVLGGMRGALSMALALSLPEDFHGRALVVQMVFAVVLFTLVAQGLALAPALRTLGMERE